MSDSILDGIIVGSAGGAIAGFMLWILDLVHKRFTEAVEKARIYKWLEANTSSEDGNRFRSTRAIASWTNLPDDRVRYLCSIHPKIFLSTGAKEDMWSLHEHGERSVYERRGPTIV